MQLNELIKHFTVSSGIRRIKVLKEDITSEWNEEEDFEDILTETYSYDESGKIISYTEENTSKSIQDSYQAHYNNEGLLIGFTISNANANHIHRIEICYNEKQHIISINTYKVVEPESEILYKNLYSYNETGKVQWHHAIAERESYHKYYYNENEILTKERIYGDTKCKELFMDREFGYNLDCELASETYTYDNGDIETLRFKYEKDKRGNWIKKSFESGEILVKREIEYYNMKKIKIVKEVECKLDEDNLLLTNKVFLKNYDINGNLLETKEFEDEECIIPIERTSYVYENGLLLIERKYDEENIFKEKTCYAYNKQRELTSKCTFLEDEADADFLDETTFKYDDDGKLIEEHYGQNSPGLFSNKLVNEHFTYYEYDDAGKKILEKVYADCEESKDGEFLGKSVYSYNGNGDTESISHYNSNGELHDKSIYNYFSFDEDGNCTEQTEQTLTEKYYTTRHMEYY